MRRIALCLLLAACGSSSSSDGPTGGDGPGASADAPLSTNSQIQLSGDLSGTFAATTTAGRKTGDAKSIIGVIATPPGYTLMSFSVQVAGDPAVKDYAAADMVGGATVSMGTKIYAASVGTGTDVGTVGTMHITSVAPLATTSQGTVWTVHGSATATLAPQAGGSANVTMNVTF